MMFKFEGNLYESTTYVSHLKDSVEEFIDAVDASPSASQPVKLLRPYEFLCMLLVKGWDSRS